MCLVIEFSSFYQWLRFLFFEFNNDKISSFKNLNNLKFVYFKFVKFNLNYEIEIIIFHKESEVFSPSNFIINFLFIVLSYNNLALYTIYDSCYLFQTIIYFHIIWNLMRESFLEGV